MSMVCVSADEIVCMRNEPIDLYLGSLENLLCLKARGRVSPLFTSKPRPAWECGAAHSTAV